MHEIDAVYRKEWGIFPFLRDMDESKAATWFIVLHLPFFLLLLSSITTAAPHRLRICVAVFSVIHVALHFFWPRTSKYMFDSFASRAWIWGSGVAGAIYLITV
jgi:hypothetical protein